MFRSLLMTPRSWGFGSTQHKWNDGKIRIFSVSDLHTDHRANWERIQQWEQERNQEREMLPTSYVDVLIIAGDLSANLTIMKDTLKFLTTIFDHIIFVPGNNEFRLRKSNNCKDSLDKLEKIYEICTELKVHSPRDGVWRMPIDPSQHHNFTSILIYPLLSWYHPAFANESLQDEKALDQLGTEYQSGWLDFMKIHWPEPYNYRTMSNYFLEENARHCAEFDTKATDFVITTSHFLPRTELVPTLSKWRRPTLMYVVGCPQLDEQIRELQSDVHVCGHTHVDHDTVIKNIRYVQHACGHPNERQQWWKSSEVYSPKLIAFL